MGPIPLTVAEFQHRLLTELEHISKYLKVISEELTKISKGVYR